jgi:hypothetical protein
MTPGRHKRNRGAQPGNQTCPERSRRNARKHGYYSRILTPEQQQALPEAAAIRSFDDEIAVLRVKIAYIMKNDPYNYPLLLSALSLLTRMLNSRQIPNTPFLQEFKDVPQNYPRGFVSTN